VLLAASAVAVVVAVVTRRSRIGALAILVGVGAAVYLVWQGRADAVESARGLVVDLDAAVERGAIAWSPGAGAGPGFLAMLAGWGVAGLGALWGIVSRGSEQRPESEPDLGAASGEADEDRGESLGQPRFLDVVIERAEDRSVGE